jgi:S-adenosyl-L-methionine hydrolase (adenosine-forming)
VQQVVTLLTDYGRIDEFAGVCHGVIRSINPDAAIIDITHGIDPYNVRQGGMVLANALVYMPVGVHVAVVDPGVGTQRRAVCVRCGDERILVGPDNGLLSLAWASCGGIAEAVEISASPYRLEPVASTFHGRDIFCPVAAHLAAGRLLTEAGTAIANDSLTQIELPTPQLCEGTLLCHAIHFDGFGNVELNATAKDLDAVGLGGVGVVNIHVGGRSYRATYAKTFSDARRGDLVLYQDSYRTLALAVNQGRAREWLDVGIDCEVRISA